MKKILMILAALAAIMALSLAAVAFENHVRWNNQLDECVYFYVNAEGDSQSCYVPEENCEGQSVRDINKDVDASTCYYIPRKEQARIAASTECEEFVEGDLIVLQYDGNDPDGDDLTYTFGEPFDEEQEWQTERGDAGEYNVRVTVNDGDLSDEAVVCFRILPGNHPPVLTVDSVAVNEGDTVRLQPECTDEDGDAVRLTYAGWMTSSSKQTGYDDAGTYQVTVICTDTEGESDQETVSITVEDVNRAPVLDVGSEDVEVVETELVRLKPTCTDLEGGAVTIAYSGDMDQATWQTGYDDAGVYSVTVTCADETDMEASELVTVTVLDKNRPPMITAMVVKG